MRLTVYSIGMLLAPIYAISAAPSAAQTMMTLTGKCQKLVIGQHDFSKFCQGKLINSAHKNGRVGFYFLFGGTSTVTFSGTDRPNPTPDTDEIRIDLALLNIGTDSQGTSRQSAKGKCSYGNPYKGKMTVKCAGTLKDGMKFSAVFRTDGRPPS
jgi:hypothetical protein